MGRSLLLPLASLGPAGLALNGGSRQAPLLPPATPAFGCGSEPLPGAAPDFLSTVYQPGFLPWAQSPAKFCGAPSPLLFSSDLTRFLDPSISVLEPLPPIPTHEVTETQ